MKYLFLILSLFLMISCRNSHYEQHQINAYSIIEGETMGTYYRITYSDTIDYKNDIDSLLLHINDEVSTYISTSTISLFNKDSVGITAHPGVFLDNFLISKELYEKSDGYYDPTVMPLVNYWGFGYQGKKIVEKIDSLAINEMKAFVGFNKIELRNAKAGLRLVKVHPKVELDFSSVAKGYAVDQIAAFLKSVFVKNYLVDIGGEMVLQGRNPKNNKWSIGINTPLENAALNESVEYLELTERALATSGNYRNFYESGGTKFSHTINPKSGFPERSNLLSVTIIAENCALADAYATACMVLGIERAEKLILTEEKIDACFVFIENDELSIKYLNNFKDYLIK